MNGWMHACMQACIDGWMDTSMHPRMHANISHVYTATNREGSVNVSSGLGPVLLSGGLSPVGRGRLGPGRARLGT